MIYVCVCDGKVIGFAGVYSDLIAAGVVCSELCSDSGCYCFVGFSWKPEESIFADSFGWLMLEVARYFSGCISYNPVSLSEYALDLTLGVKMFEFTRLEFLELQYAVKRAITLHEERLSKLRFSRSRADTDRLLQQIDDLILARESSIKHLHSVLDKLDQQEN